ncbi:hypothetical protein AAFF_G00346620 [Aldrovandia affinis]|uniref:Uncharacterized protein n=1 Tax=Aldrovandia affinis TaxID=143900 RepID=A0AAD7SJP3_9TELE|nr:hypothetical protein AAFF_G00346620 [Aldrovandia affinis]
MLTGRPETLGCDHMTEQWARSGFVWISPQLLDRGVAMGTWGHSPYRTDTAHSSSVVTTHRIVNAAESFTQGQTVE